MDVFCLKLVDNLLTDLLRGVGTEEYCTAVNITFERLHLELD